MESTTSSGHNGMPDADLTAQNTYNSHPEMESTTSSGHNGMADADLTQTSTSALKVTRRSTTTTIKTTFQKVILKFRDIKFLRKTT
jgi:hypothetical protein